MAGDVLGGGMSLNIFLAAAAGCGFILLLFFLCRHFVCWYWKLNEIVDLLAEISEHMKDSRIVVYKEKKV